MTTGRKPKPPQLRVLEGGDARKMKRARNALTVLQRAMPQAGDSAPPPVSVADVEAALLRWIEGLRPLTCADRAAVAHAAATYGIATSAAHQVLVEGIIVQSGRGRRPHPGVQVFRNLSGEFRRWLAEFGITPTSAGKLGDLVQATAELDEMARLLTDGQTAK